MNLSVLLYRRLRVNPLFGGLSFLVIKERMLRGSYSTTWNDMKLVHWPVMGELLHLVQ